MADGVKREFGSVAASHPAPYATRGPPDADRKPVAASATAALGSPHPPAASASPTPHKIQLKSADMKDEMQKEAFEISRLVIPLFFLSFFSLTPNLLLGFPSPSICSRPRARCLAGAL
jgi:hypothetical protein